MVGWFIEVSEIAELTGVVDEMEGCFNIGII